MARTLSAEDKRILAEIKAEQAARKKSKGGAKDLQKELKDAKAKRKTPKFNSKGLVIHGFSLFNWKLLPHLA